MDSPLAKDPMLQILPRRHFPRHLFTGVTNIMKFYNFDQNNSGGSFVHQPESGIGYNVCIEAESMQEAIDKAESIGLYFNGCEYGQDCSCCGDRWSHPFSFDIKDTPDECMAGCGFPGYIHYANGNVVEVKEKS